MRPPKFHIGQAVVCIKKDPKEVYEGIIGPRIGPIYTVNYLEYYKEKEVCNCVEGWYIGFAESPGNECYHESDFAPVELASDEALAQLLEESLAPPVTADII